MVWGLLRAPEAVALLTVKYAFSHLSWHFFFKQFNPSCADGNFCSIPVHPRVTAVFISQNVFLARQDFCPSSLQPNRTIVFSIKLHSTIMKSILSSATLFQKHFFNICVQLVRSTSVPVYMYW